MGSKKGRGAKALTMPPDKRPDDNHSDFSTMSTIDKASFLEGLEKSYGNVLHSTAVEDDLNVIEEGQVNDKKPGGKDDPQTKKASAKQRGAALKRKQAETHGEIGESKENNRKRSRTAPVEINEEHAPAAKSHKKLVGKKPVKQSGTGQKSALRPVNNEQIKREKKKKSKSRDGKSSDSQSPEGKTGTVQQRRSKILSSEDEADEDTTWNPSLQKAKVHSLSRARKSSSSGSTSAGAEKPSISDHRKKKRGPQRGTDLEVVLDAFLEFCNKYSESVESKVVKQSVDSFSNNVKEQLLEKISFSKELKVLQRENAKVGSLIRRKTQRLLDAKNELMRAERQVWILQKEKAELEIRLADLRRGHAFLHDIRELNRQYLDHRDKHPKEKEAYGTSSLPALLLQAKYIQTPEQQLKAMTNRMKT